jgi:hypothetical protein
VASPPASLAAELPSVSPPPPHAPANPATTINPAASRMAPALPVPCSVIPGETFEAEPRFPVAWHRPMSTRRLILAALLCGLAILVAFSVQLALVL